MDLWFNFFIIGPFVLWVLTGAIIYNALIQRRGVKTTEKVVTTLERLTTALGKDNGDLKSASDELREDTSQLTVIITQLIEQLKIATATTNGWHESLKKIYWYLPLGGGDKK